MTTYAAPSCATCTRLHFPGKGPPPRCEAFPDEPGIPADIWEGRDPHTTPHAGDHGLLYEPDAKGKKIAKGTVTL